MSLMYGTSLGVKIGWSVWFLVPMFLIFLVYFFIKQRNAFPVASRLLWIKGVFIAMLTLAAFITPFSRLTDMPCDLYFAALLFAENLIFTTFLIRGIYILFQLRVVEMINKITDWTASQEEKEQGRNDWYMRNAKRILTDKAYLLFFGIDVLCCAAVVIGIICSGLSRNGGSGTSPDFLNMSCIVDKMITHPLNLARIASSALKFVLTGYLALRLWAFGTDSNMVKTELTLIAAVTIPCFVVYYAILGAAGDNSWTIDVVLSVYMVMLLAIMCISIAKPVHLSIFVHVDSEAAYYQGRQPDISNLADIINSKVGYNAFVLFLKSEFSEENLFFWREVQTFVNRCQKLLQGVLLESSDMNKLLETKILNREITAELSKTAINIFDMYCKRGAVSQVNISDTVLHELQTQLSNLQAERVEVVLDKISNLFDSVKSQVFELMDKDSFARFKQSASYINLRGAMVTSGWIDTSGGETLDSFDLPPGLITVLDADEERQKAMERRREAQRVKPEVVKQQRKDIRASHMLTIAAKMNRQHLIELTHKKQQRTSPVDTTNVMYPYVLPNQTQVKTAPPTPMASNNQANKAMENNIFPATPIVALDASSHKGSLMSLPASKHNRNPSMDMDMMIPDEDENLAAMFSSHGVDNDDDSVPSPDPISLRVGSVALNRGGGAGLLDSPTPAHVRYNGHVEPEEFVDDDAANVSEVVSKRVDSGRNSYRSQHSEGSQRSIAIHNIIEDDDNDDDDDIETGRKSNLSDMRSEDVSD